MVSRTNDNERVSDGQLWVLVLAGAVLLLLGLLLLWGSPARQDMLSLARTSLGIQMQGSLRVALGQQAQIMALPLDAGSQAYWYLARAGGIVAYLLLWLATCWGILMSSKMMKGVVSVPVAYALHEYLPILGVLFAAIHAIVLLGDTYIGFSLSQILIPFTSPYKPAWTGLGSIALYLSIALIASSYLRKHIGQKAWRVFHFTSYLAFVLALVHGLKAGSDSGTLSLRVMYMATGGISLFLVYFRTLSYVPRPRRRSRAARVTNESSGD